MNPEWTHKLLHIASLIGAFASLVVSALHAPVAVAAYLLLFWGLLLFFRIHHQEIFGLWILYGFAYWATGVGKEDNAALLALTTLVHAGAIVAHFSARNLLRENQWIVVAFGSILIIPIQCNNPYYTPAFGLARVIVFAAIQILDGDALWILLQYPLFCKQEALPLLVIFHLIVRKWSTPAPQGLPLTTPSEHHHHNHVANGSLDTSERRRAKSLLDKALAKENRD